MRGPWLILLLAIGPACAPDSESHSPEDRLSRRRIALGLDRSDPIEFRAAMQALEEDLEPELKRAAVGRIDPVANVDTALRIQDLLDRADRADRDGAGKLRAPDPEDFDARLEESARRSGAWALAAVGGDAERSRGEAKALLLSCIECHKLYRN